jgi:D-alanyl-lipoteichoic acid acyltransferase DltB (MBOAT superfamily)
MLFNSLDFAVFLPLVFALFWAIPARRTDLRNGLLLLASYVFYGWWDVRFLALIAFSTLLDYFLSIGIASSTDERRRRLLLWTSLGVNLGLLGFFKYFNFFLDQLNGAFSLFGMPLGAERLDIILPVGISFYTFQTLSYTIDVYRGDLKASRDPVAFAAFVSFFPQLVAGPIERASNLLPQFAVPRQFTRSEAVRGSRQILWGFFKKLVIADNCAEQVDRIFAGHEAASASTLVLGAVLFAFQIYGDFSGYSDIAIGVSRLFGFQLMRNFAFPYFSRDMAEFWRRWHISLSTWFRDYLYVPLGGSRGGTAMRVRNTFIIFLVSGFWHGANWTFLVWGALNALYFLPLLLSQRNRQHLGIVAEGRLLPGLRDSMSMVGTFALTCIAWVFFRARDLEHALDYLGGMASGSLFSKPLVVNNNLPVLLAFFIAVEWWGRAGEHGLEQIGLRWPRLFRWGFYALLIGMIGLFMRTEEAPFIYFQF